MRSTTRARRPAKVAVITRAARLKARREKLIGEHAPLVEKIALQVYGKLTQLGQDDYSSHIELEELMACGNIGLVEAAARYKPSLGVFAHFAYFRIRGAMIDAHKRSAYRDRRNESLEGIEAGLGFLPAHLQTCDKPLPDDVAARRQQAHLLNEAVSELEPEERQVFARYLEGASLADVAMEYDRSIAWARAKLASARSQLGARVISWGIGFDKAA